jgi:hypothetical protein
VNLVTLHALTVEPLKRHCSVLAEPAAATSRAGDEHRATQKIIRSV